MGCAYDIHCETCNEWANYDMNWGVDVLRKLVVLGPNVKALKDKSVSIGLDVDIQFHYGKDAGWMGYHVGHMVRIVDEYGREVALEESPK